MMRIASFRMSHSRHIYVSYTPSSYLSVPHCKHGILYTDKKIYWIDGHVNVRLSVVYICLSLTAIIYNYYYLGEH